jgi:hypothetical protein
VYAPTAPPLMQKNELGCISCGEFGVAHTKGSPAAANSGCPASPSSPLSLPATAKTLLSLMSCRAQVEFRCVAPWSSYRSILTGCSRTPPCLFV